MIDDPNQTTRLLEEMEASVPIPVRPTPELAAQLQSNTDALPPIDEWTIQSVLYLGDTGGISCGLCPAEGSKAAVIVSLTHLRIDGGHPLAERIRKYQSRRTKKLTQLNAPGSRRIPTPKPNAKRRKRK